MEGLRGRLRAPDASIRLQRFELTRQVQALQQAMQQRLQMKSQQLSFFSGRLDALSPLKVLGRGYSIARLEKSGEVLRDAQQVQAGDLLTLQLEKGVIGATVSKFAGDKLKKKLDST